MNYEEIYKSKLMTAEEAVKTHIKSGDKLLLGGLNVADKVLSQVVENVKDGSLQNISLYGNFSNYDIGLADEGIPEGQLRYYAFFYGVQERLGAKNGTVIHVPLHLNQMERYMSQIGLDVAIIPMTPPDEQGYCNIGPAGYATAGINHSKKIIAQINKHIPHVYGSSHDYHVSEIAAFVEYHNDAVVPPSPPSSETDEKIASYILERIPDGACIQLGIGGTSNAVGYGLKDKKHLGVHSEMFTDSMAYLQGLGVIDNSQKTYMPGRSVAGFAFNTEASNKFIDKNPKVFFEPYHVVNNIQSIASNDNMVSINTSLSIDLTGQVCSESIGMRQYSGSGGQVDYIRGATLSKGGKSFIAVSSVANTKNGPVSKICLSLAPGSIVTTLRAEVMYIVTEYGCVNLQFCDVPTRAKRLISIAHPDFRDELTFEAKKNGLLY
ncbi:MAG: 4-hydroxybutyrate--acetyl-CoA CoA transferase [Clostridiales bacterium]|nr:4-hydroxybutyrate--acetyl-CoA CoA transferase [Clostridiales bacterium]